LPKQAIDMTQFISPKNLVIYADDDPDDLELVQDALKQHTHNVEVITFQNGLEALSYLSRLKDEDITPCLIILDVNMPIVNGKETLERIRNIKRFDKVPVVLFTTSSFPADKEFARQYNAGFITKPIDYNQMELIANNFIEHCSEETRKRIKKTI
jgi:CheY-like chemotaxis protein